MKVIAHPDNSTSYELVESTLENPLIDPKHRDLLTMKISIPGGPFRKKNQSDESKFLINVESNLINCVRSYKYIILFIKCFPSYITKKDYR